MIILHSVAIFLLPTTLLIFISALLLRSKRGLKNLPPSPPSIPIIGHLHLLPLPLHRALCRLSNRYGPVLLLHFGSRPVLTITSPAAVDECFTKNDITFANRPRLPHGKYVSYNYTALAAASYGPSLRSLRRVAALEIFSPARIRSLSSLFNEEVKLMIKDLYTDGRDGTFVKADMKTKFSELMFNVIMKILAGKRYFGVNADCATEEGKQFREVIQELFDALDVANPEDFLPFLKWFGFKGHHNRLERLGRKMDQLFQEMIEDRRRDGGKQATTVIDVLLSLQETDGEQYSDELIKGTILTLIAAGTHTTSGTMEWAMSLLLNHPDSQQKARDEIDKQVGQNRLVGYTDVQNLIYINNVIKETLRLFPTVPLLLPHESSSECTVEGFNIPNSTILFANAYAIHRDPENWTEPTEFKPERFENGELHASKIYFPFGLGRRSCPGEGLAMVVVGLALGTLIQCFEWERTGKQNVDMSEGSGLTMPKAKPLEAMYKPRQGMIDVLNNI